MALEGKRVKIVPMNVSPTSLISWRRILSTFRISQSIAFLYTSHQSSRHELPGVCSFSASISRRTAVKRARIEYWCVSDCKVSQLDHNFIFSMNDGLSLLHISLTLKEDKLKQRTFLLGDLF